MSEEKKQDTDDVYNYLESKERKGGLNQKPFTPRPNIDPKPQNLLIKPDQCHCLKFKPRHYCPSCGDTYDAALCVNCGERGYKHKGYETDDMKIDRLEKENANLKAALSKYEKKDT